MRKKQSTRETQKCLNRIPVTTERNPHDWPVGYLRNICYGCGRMFVGPGVKRKPMCRECDP